MQSTYSGNAFITFLTILLASLLVIPLAATSYSSVAETKVILEEAIDEAVQEPLPEVNPDEALQPEDPAPVQEPVEAETETTEAIAEEPEANTDLVPKADEEPTAEPEEAPAAVEPNESGQPKLDGKPNPIVTIEMVEGGIITVELLPVYAPNTVANFISLANEGFYDGLIFHRVIQDFMVQGGDPEGTGMGGSGYAIFGEFASNGFENALSHKRGVISMARSGEPNSAGSQFFICVNDASFLDGEYAAFGIVTDEESMAAVDSIVMSDTPNSLYASGVAPEDIKDAEGNAMEFTEFNVDMPIFTQQIKTITVETFGVEYEVEVMPEPTYWLDDAEDGDAETEENQD